MHINNKYNMIGNFIDSLFSFLFIALAVFLGQLVGFLTYVVDGLGDHVVLPTNACVQGLQFGIDGFDDLVLLASRTVG